MARRDDLAEMQVSGMTDLQIVYEALSNEGVTQDDVLARVEMLASRLTEEARKITGNGTRFFELLPGVRETLRSAGRSSAISSRRSLTGNIKSMAQLKMELVGLDKFFTLPGAFGDESHNRRDLPAPPLSAFANICNSISRRSSSSSSATRQTTSTARVTSARAPSQSARAGCTRPLRSSRANLMHSCPISPMSTV